MVASASLDPAAESARTVAAHPDCPLCGADDDKAVHLVARCREWRVVRVLDTPDHPAFWRVIWNDHAAELTDLEPQRRSTLMQTVCKVEAVVRRDLQPFKVNLASLGNVVSHLHWHVVARWQDDSHFPQPIWGARQRDSTRAHLMRLEVQLPQVDRAIQAALMSR
jgi:diadenosine tetraphosphate (Ap4A) HIT family hydrolase